MSSPDRLEDGAEGGEEFPPGEVGDAQPLVRVVRGEPDALELAALIAGLGGYFIGESNGSVLAAEPLQAEVTRVLQDDFGLVEVSDVVCPEQVKVDQGSEFQCTFTYAEQDQSVTVTVSSADGQVVVGAPE